MSQTYYILGTDTGCGKTKVMCSLLKFYQKKNIRVIGLKPVASGGIWHEGTFVNEDVFRIEQSMPKGLLTRSEINPYALQLPVSPHIAAQKEGIIYGVEDICAHIQDIKERHKEKVILIEGAGGLLSPITSDGRPQAEILKYLDCELIFVVGLKLGCLSMAHLCYEYMKNQGIKPFAWTYVLIEPDMLCIQENIESLEKIFGQKPLLF